MLPPSLDAAFRTLLDDALCAALPAHLQALHEELARLRELVVAQQRTLVAGEDPYVSVATAAKLTDMEPKTIRAWMARGLRAYKPPGGAHLLMRMSDLRAFVESAEEPDTDFTESERVHMTVALNRLRKTG